MKDELLWFLLEAEERLYPTSLPASGVTSDPRLLDALPSLCGPVFPSNVKRRLFLCLIALAFYSLEVKDLLSSFSLVCLCFLSYKMRLTMPTS